MIVTQAIDSGPMDGTMEKEKLYHFHQFKLIVYTFAVYKVNGEKKQIFGIQTKNRMDLRESNANR